MWLLYYTTSFVNKCCAVYQGISAFIGSYLGWWGHITLLGHSELFPNLFLLQYQVHLTNKYSKGFKWGGGYKVITEYENFYLDTTSWAQLAC